MRKKRILAGLLAVSMLSISLAACSDSDVTDQVANVVQSEDENVLSVKGASPGAYPGITYGEAFENFFGYPTWKYFVGTKEGADEDGDGEPDYTEENVDIVEFTGYCTYEDVEVKALIQFTLDNEEGTFTATYLSFNDIPQSMFMLYELLDTVFTSGTDTATEVQEPEVEAEVATEEPEVETEDAAEEAARLEEFIELICSYSDPPDYQGNELEEYYEEQYELWQADEGYTNITVDSTGHLVIEEHTEFLGQWWDTVSQRCHMDITCTDGVYYYIDINWSSGASENTHWSFVGLYDSVSNGIVYYGSEIEELYLDDGSMQETYIYTDGEGLLFIGDDGALHWEDYKENMGENCIFSQE